jgi:hypothetical protein
MPAGRIETRATPAIDEISATTNVDKSEEPKLVQSLSGRDGRAPRPCDVSVI